jgi:hypothetical protein
MEESAKPETENRIHRRGAENGEKSKAAQVRVELSRGGRV